MCGTPDYGSLVLMSERMLILSIGLLGTIFLYLALNRVRNQDVDRFVRFLDTVFNQLRLR